MIPVNGMFAIQGYIRLASDHIRCCPTARRIASRRNTPTFLSSCLMSVVCCCNCSWIAVSAVTFQQGSLVSLGPEAVPCRHVRISSAQHPHSNCAETGDTAAAGLPGEITCRY